MTKLHGLSSEKSFNLPSGKNGDSKTSIFKRKKKTMIARYNKKNSSIKLESPKNGKLIRRKQKKGNLTRPISPNRNINTVVYASGKTSKVRSHKNLTGVGDETQAQVPSEMNVKRSFIDNRKDTDASKSTFTIQSKLSNSSIFNPTSHKRLDFEKIMELAKGTDMKKTEFIIPKHLGRKISEDQNTLNKYLKDAPNVQSHTIHIDELLNSGSKDSFSFSGVKATNISNMTSIKSLQSHKRVKSHHLISVSLI